MPIYQYRCNDCGNDFEVSQRMSEDSLTDCDVCRGQLTKVLFAPAIHFKGTGFHNTDYGTRRRNAESEGSGGGSGEGGGSGGEGGASDAKKNGDGGAKADSAKSGSDSGSSGKKTVGLDKV